MFRAVPVARHISLTILTGILALPAHAQTPAATGNAASVAGDDPPVTLEPLGGGKFRFVAPTGGGVVGEVVRFVEEAGRPMRMYTGDSWIDRARMQ